VKARPQGEPGSSRRSVHSEWRHPNDWDLYTPITEDILSFMSRLHDINGSWRKVAEITETRLRVLRRIRTGERKTISMTLLDRMLTRLDVGGITVEDFDWYTPNELVERGIWQDTYYIADQAISPEQIEKNRARRKRLRKRLEKNRRENWIEPR